jgi:hypothetical protein
MLTLKEIRDHAETVPTPEVDGIGPVHPVPNV